MCVRSVCACLVCVKSTIQYCLTMTSFHVMPWCGSIEVIKFDEFILNMSINSDISVMGFPCAAALSNMYYHLSLSRRLRSIFTRDLLLQVYTSYTQPRLDYGIILYRCSTQDNIDLVQRVQNSAMLITGNFDYTNCRGLDLVKSLNLYTILDT